MNEAQRGFRKGKSIQDHIFIRRQIIEKRQKMWKQILIEFLWEIMEEKSVEIKVLRMIKMFYDQNANALLYKGWHSRIFKTNEGLR